MFGVLEPTADEAKTYPRYRDTVLARGNHRMEHNEQQLLRRLVTQALVLLALSLPLVLSLRDLC